MSKVIFITGSSSGLGLELVKAALSQGHRVAATLRQPKDFPQSLLTEHADSLKTFPLDVTNKDQVDSALKATVEAFGKIDIIVNNAGWTVMGEFETMPEDLARKQFETVFWGTINVLKESIPLLRKQGGGKIVTVSSMVGLGGGLPLLSFFAAAKSGVEAVIDSVQAEMSPDWNIELRVVEPGGFKTEAMNKAGFVPPVAPYNAPDHPMTHFRNSFAGGTLGDASKAAQTILKFSSLEASPDVAKPARLVIGQDGIGYVDARLDGLKKQLAAWKDLAAEAS
ncbi:hypothetical protein BD324DRAFT_191694 [Kockovaella imperatae]|uniref:Short-chain dehydrogenase/reductase SDR n=1 Tax=Kockovaella imperatae TaxID=4999 RepID=A0A1Y1U7K1_9TREE|nr:hypothetical protein BD324DRAFT_191694 [Kockovaella imperatae]ORX34010.1 hypothetical protein BD324DRAFT_191694 [Kockovaella imperatae]